MSILVTGSAGFIGSHLVDRLLARGFEVVGLDSFDGFYDRRIKEENIRIARKHAGFMQIEGDIRDAAILESLPQSVRTVVHLAALAGVRPSIQRPAEYVSVNLQGTVTLLDWMRGRGIRDLVFASSSSVYGNNVKVPFSETDPVDLPISPYAATKRAGELICHAYHHLFGISVVALRFFTVYGPRQRPDLAIHKFARLIQAGRSVPQYGDGTTERDYTYIDDILAGVEGAVSYVAAGEPRYDIINLGESATISLSRMIQTLAEEMDEVPKIEYLPLQPGDVQKTYADVSKARRLLGYEPSTDFRSGIRAFVRWLESDSKRNDR
jgi:UDP-glucuronate 4-epimerase